LELSIGGLGLQYAAGYKLYKLVLTIGMLMLKAPCPVINGTNLVQAGYVLTILNPLSEVIVKTLFLNSALISTSTVLSKLLNLESNPP